LDEAKAELQVKEEIKEVLNASLSPNIEIGSLVKIKGFDSVGKILQIGKEKVLVEMGLIKSRLDFDQVEPISKKEAITPKTRIKGYNYEQISREFSPRLDVRGMKTEDALAQVMTLVDNALVLSMDKLWVLHGKGDGILRKMIRENLKKVSHVKSLESEHVDFGGDGITIINLG
jgi:DNA mismatch repair protein MutS2